MALNPLIPLSGGTPPGVDVGAAFNNSLLNVQRLDTVNQNRDIAAQREADAPIRSRLLEAQAGTAEQEQAQSQQLNEIRSVAMGASQLIPFLEKGDIDGALNNLMQRKTEIVSRQGDTTQTDQAIALLQTEGGADKLLSGSNELISRAQQFGVIDAPTKGQTGAQKDFAEFQRLSSIAEETGDPEDITAAKQFGQKANISRATPQELADIDVKKAGEIAQTRADIELATTGKIEGTKSAAKAAIARSEKAFDQTAKIKTNVLNIDEAISLIDQGAESGVIQSKLPSVRAQSVALDNLQSRLGLDVIGNTTFGALSESELAFALKTALPTNLSPPDLRRWLVRKKDAQLKLAGYLEEVASFLGTPGNTTKDFIELQKVRQLEAESPQVDDNTFTSKSGITFKVN